MLHLLIGQNMPLYIDFSDVFMCLCKKNSVLKIKRLVLRENYSNPKEISMTVTSATLRFATPEELADSSLNPWSELNTTPLWVDLQKSEFQKLRANKSDYFLKTEVPARLETWMNSHSELKYEREVLTRHPCGDFGLSFDRVDIPKKKLIKAMLKPSRNGEFFIPSKGMKAIEDFLQECFPGITTEDLILSCKKDKTTFFHKLLRGILQPKCIKEYLPTIRQECRASFEAVKDNEQVNATEMARNFFTRSFGQNIFNNRESGLRLNDHLDTFKQLISRQACGQATQEDVFLKEELVQAVRNTISEILTENPDLFAVDESQGERPLDEGTKGGLIFLLVFAAQDNTTTTLSAALWRLAGDPNKQARLREACREFQKNPQGIYPKELNDFFIEVMQTHTAVPGVTRIAAQDLCFEFSLDSDIEGSPHKAIILKNVILVGRLDKIGRENLLDPLHFGSGLHICPGQYYAKNAIKEFLVCALAKYQMELVGPEELLLKLAFTAVLEEPVKIVFKQLAS